MDIVYPLIETKDGNRELLYSLRSLQNIEHGKVFIVGFKPCWVKNVIHIPCNDPYSQKVNNTIHKLLKVCQDERLSDDFVLMNDDFYILEPTEIKYYHQGTIKEHIARRKKWGHIGSRYCYSLERTSELYPQGKDYELHIPFKMNKEKFLSLKFDFEKPLLFRNQYGNEYKVGGIKTEDCKVGLSDLHTIRNYKYFLSSDDNMIKNKDFMDFLEEKFQKESKFEDESKIMPENSKVKFTRSIYPYRKGDTATLKTVKALHLKKRGFLELIQDKSMAEKPKETKQVHRQERKEDEYIIYTVPRLIALCKERGIPCSSKLRKNDLIKKLCSH